MQELSNGKVRRSRSEWMKLLTRQRKSGQSTRAFCEKEGIALSSFTNWSRKLLTSDGSESLDEFVEVPTAATTPSSWVVEVSLPNGCTLRFQG